MIACTLFTTVKSQQLVVDSISFTLNAGATCTRIGDLTAHAAGGTPYASGLPYDYYWYELVYNNITGGDDTVALNLPADSVANDLPPGKYLVKVRDIVPDSAYSQYFNYPANNLSITSMLTSCYGGSNGILNSEDNGGDIVSYLWSNGDTGIYADSLAAGTYTVIVTNSSGCQDVFSGTVNEPDEIHFNASVSLTCNFNTNGRRISIDLSVTGGTQDGTGNYTSYLWNGPSGFTGTSQDIINNYGDDGGTYNVEVTDDEGCTADTTFDFVAYQHLFATGSQYLITNPTCYGAANGSVLVDQFGGTAPYVFLWGEGGSPNTFYASNYISGLVENAYYVYNVSDAIGCIKNLLTPLAFDVLQPPQLTGSLSVMDVQCNDSSTGSINLIINGGTPFMASGTPTYHYYWSNGPVNTESISNLHAGSYDVVVIDSMGCAITLDTTIINLSPPITTSSTHFDLLCNSIPQGWAKLTVAGGEPAGGPQPYQCAWTGPMVTIPGNGTDSIYNLQAGRYYVTVTDVFLCQKFDSVLILQPPNPISIVLDTTSVTCYGGTNGSAIAIVSGGTAFTTGLPYKYYWTRAGFSDTTDAISNLSAANYLLRVTDANGCYKDTSIQILGPEVLVINGNAQPPLCPQSCNGFIQLNYNGGITGGTAPYNFVWSNASDSLNITNLCAGNYTISITDAHFCTASKSFELIDPAGEVIHLGPDKTICSNQTYYADATVSQPATYAWTSDNGFTAQTAVAAITQAGTYFVEATTTTGGCISKDTIAISASNEQISSEFIVSTQAFRGQTVRVVNISEPRPASVEWLIPNSPNITVQSSSQTMIELLFSQTGTYSIGMKSFSGSCEDSTKKEVIVVEPEPFNPLTQVDDPLIREFTVTPNPNNGQFRVYIKLKEISRVRLRLYNLVTSSLENDRGANNGSEYTLSYNLNLSAGVYALLLETPKSSMVYKILVQ